MFRPSSDPIEINHAVIADLTVGEMSKIHLVDGSTGIQILHVMVTTGVLYVTHLSNMGWLIAKLLCAY